MKKFKKGVVIKKRKPLSLTKLAIKAEHLQRDYIFKTEGRSCEFPKCKEPAYCVDHHRSRTVHQLFFYKPNLVRICRGHHNSKTNQYHGVHLEQEELILERNGIKEFEYMRRMELEHKPDPNWNRNYLLEKIEHFKKLLDK